MKHAQFICHFKLTWCSFLMCIPQFLVGSSISYSSTLLTQLRDASSTIKLNTEEESWITSVAMLICPIGLLLSGVLLDKVGRRKSLQWIHIFMILSWLIFAFANSFATILIGRIILGIAYGLSICVVLYIAEVCPTNLRPLYMAINPLCTGCGMMLETALAMYFNWQTISAFLFVAGLINYLTLFLVPESPVWLRSKGRNEEADKVDKWFNLKHIDNAVINEPSSNGMNGSSVGCQMDDKKSYWSLYLQPTVWKPLLVTILFFVLQQFSGLYVIFFYSADVLRDFRVPGNVIFLISLSRILGSVIFALCHKVKRRTLMMVSGGSMAVSLIVIITYIKIFRDVENPPFQMIPITSLIIFMFTGLLGMLPLPWMICGEVFPIAVKGVVNGFVQACGFLLWFAVCKMYPWLVSKFGLEMIWSIFSIVCILNVLFAIFIMPETHGKSLDEVIMYFDSPKKIKSNHNP